MTLPSAHLAVVDERKVVDYLLNAAHPDNGGKSKFFAASATRALTHRLSSRL